MPLEPGTRLGHYDVTALLGEGGMGQVWQATDTQLNRQVALKILPDAFADDPDRLARFTREAQILASLNHPNIAAIYGIEEAEGTRALVLELVEGPTLADRISTGPIPLDEALPIAKQIAEALEAAHEAGVIHRDLKPANIKVREDGTVKVLDFGLAKALDPNPDADPSQSPTLTAAATQMGVIMGTAAYMSPEQASGSTADKRADIWSFGVVLFEMLTGQRLFTGKTVSHVLAKILDRKLDFAVLPTATPAPVKRLLRRCLEKEQKRRLRDVGEALIHLEEAATAPADEPAAGSAVVPQHAGWRRALPWAAAVALAAVVGLAVWTVRPSPAPDSVRRFAISLLASDTLAFSASGPSVALSPDGETLVYAATRSGVSQLFRRAMGELEAVSIRGTEGANFPVFSPDSAWVAFTAGGVLKKIALAGGPAVTLYDDEAGADVSNASWGPNDTLVFGFNGNGQDLLQVSASGGAARPVTTLAADDGETDHRWPELLPGGDALLFTVWSGPSLSGLDSAQIAVKVLATGERRLLVPGSFPRYAPTGHLVFVQTDGLWAVPFDLDRLEVTGPALPVLQGLQVTGSGRGQFALGGDGSLVYVPGAGVAVGAQRSLVWVDREGGEEPLATPVLPYRTPSISPDGTRVAFDVQDPDGADIWIHDLRRGTEAILTTDATSRAPLWTPDGERVVFYSDRDGGGLFSKVVDTPGEAEPVMTREGTRFIEPGAWSADRRTLVFWEAGGQPPDIGLLSMEGDRASELLLATESVETGPSISPDGNWIAYSSDETGQPEVYVQRFPGLGAKEPISTDGGLQPVWSPDGTELFYRGPRGMMAVPVETGPTFSAGDPEVLFEQQYYFDRSRRTYDLAPDGRFLMIKDGATTDGAAQTAQITVVLNWFEELERLVPVN